MGQQDGKRLVLFSDGTGNQLKAKGNTNVLRLHSMTRETPDQLRYYDPGVGTEGSPRALTPIGRSTTQFLGLVFGYGVKRNVIEMYTFIMNNWEPGDKIYLFGFSRGSYTVRALAGMLRVIGLLQRGQDNLVPYALRLFWKGHGKNIDWDTVNNFAGEFGRADFPRWGKPVEYIGLWDTVKSVGWFRRRLQLPYTRTLKSVRRVRHAVSLDEWRGQYKSYTVSEDEAAKDNRDIKEVWFAGVHSGVGGTFETDHGLADIALQWITDEATHIGEGGLDIDDDQFDAYRTQPPGNALHELHRMGWFWALTGVSKRKIVPTGAPVHESVVIRMNARPEWRARYQKKGANPNVLEPWPHAGPPTPTPPQT
jgi:uncharacterized protein (DUF2235 family)